MGISTGRRRLVVASAVVVAAVAAVTVVATRAGDGDAAGCLSGLATHLPADIDLLSGTDLDRTQAAGLAVDGRIERVLDVVRETNLQLDPLTEERLHTLDESTDSAGFGIDEMRCWVGDATGGRFVGRGSFDGDAVAAGDAGTAGEAATRGDLVAYDRDGDPEPLLGASPAGRPPLVALIEGLDQHGAVTFTGVSSGDQADDHWTALGLAGGDGDGWELILVWGFADADRAAAGRAGAIDAIERGDVAGMIEGDAADLLHQDGPTLWLRAPIVGDTGSWAAPMEVFDPVFTAFADVAD
jgi:hypothetical protein